MLVFRVYQDGLLDLRIPMRIPRGRLWGVKSLEEAKVWGLGLRI